MRALNSQGHCQNSEKRPRNSLINASLFEAQSSVDITRNPAHRGDTAYVAGCLFLSVACLVQLLYALHQEYFVNEKETVAAVDLFPLPLNGFAASVVQALEVSGKDGVAERDVLAREVHSAVPWRAAAVGYRSAS